MSDPDLKGLQRRCVETLRRYIAEANKTCSLLESVLDFPVSMPERLKIIEQRAKENYAQSEYQATRAALFDATKWDE
jgi:hypothetical protein